jgi:hypothetical protein
MMGHVSESLLNATALAAPVAAAPPPFLPTTRSLANHDSLFTVCVRGSGFAACKRKANVGTPQKAYHFQLDTFYKST